MRKLLLMLLFIPLVFATGTVLPDNDITYKDYDDEFSATMLGGQSYHLGRVKECSGDIIKLSVNTNQKIDDKEINFTGCNVTEENTKSQDWECPCKSNFDIILNTHKYAVNKYTIRIRYDDVDTVINNDDSNNEGISLDDEYYKYLKNKTIKNNDISEVINNNVKLNNKVSKTETISGPEEPINNINDTQKPDPSKKIKLAEKKLPPLVIPEGAGWVLVLVGVIVLLLVGGMGFMLYKFVVATPDEDYDEADVKRLVKDIEAEDINFSKTKNISKTDDVDDILEHLDD